MSEREHPWPSRVLSPQTAMALLAQGASRIGLLEPALRHVTRGLLLSESEALLQYDPTEHDVFVATYAKSGTNWAMQISLQIAHRGEAEFRHIHDVVAWPEGPFEEIVALDDPAPRLSSPTGQRIIKTHLCAEAVPFDPAARYLTVVRDPKEAFVSAYYFLLGQLGVLDRITPKQWVDLAAAPLAFPRSWARHTASFWALKDRPNVMVVFFDEIKRDLPAFVDRVSAWMGVELSSAERARVLEKSSFAYMKAHDGAFAPPPTPLVRSAQRPRMMRRGASGGSSEMLDDRAKAEIDRRCASALRRLASDFPYERFVSG